LRKDIKSSFSENSEKQFIENTTINALHVEKFWTVMKKWNYTELFQVNLVVNIHSKILSLFTKLVMKVLLLLKISDSDI
jgi:hypothetical protein